MTQDPISGPLPLSEFPAAHRERIEELASRPYPPPKWISFGEGSEGRPLCSMMSRAYYEWYLRRGRDIRLRPIRDKIPLALRERVIRRDGLWCGLCGGPVERDDIHIDHIRPVSLGGKTVLANLQVAHSLCNLKKGNRVHDVG